MVEPVDVTYTSSSPLRSTASEPAFASSANSSDAEAPPVWTSEMSRVETGQATAATAIGGSAIVAARVVDRRLAAPANDVPNLTHAEKLDVFFATEQQYNPNYLRVFRETDRSSVVIDLLDRMTY